MPSCNWSSLSSLNMIGFGAQECVVPDGVTSSQTDPLGNGAVLLLGLGQLDLGAERLVALYREKEVQLAICSMVPSIPSLQSVIKVSHCHREDFVHRSC